MTRHHFLRAALACATLLCASLVAAPAWADESPPRERPQAPPAAETPSSPSTFGAEAPEAPLPAVAPGDFEGLLRNCDIERGRAVAARRLCDKDERAIPFIGGAYLALWAVLMAFFIVVAVRQKRLRAEMAVLRERLARYGTAAEGDTAPVGDDAR